MSIFLMYCVITGDFAMLLNAGMTAKQALVYNCVSSVLCMLGMVFGVAVGNISSATSWIFALIAGLFLYVALVDMVVSRLIPSIHFRKYFCSLRKLIWHQKCIQHRTNWANWRGYMPSCCLPHPWQKFEELLSSW